MGRHFGCQPDCLDWQPSADWQLCRPGRCMLSWFRLTRSPCSIDVLPFASVPVAGMIVGCRSLRKDESLHFERLRTDLRDFHAAGHPLLAQAGRSWVGFGKHLCGSATDFGLRCCLGQSSEWQAEAGSCTLRQPAAPGEPLGLSIAPVAPPAQGSRPASADTCQHQQAAGGSCAGRSLHASAR